MLKYCTYCITDKPITEFHKRWDAPDGRGNMCKSCKSEYDSRRRKMMPEKFREWDRQYKEANKEKLREYNRARNKRIYWENKNKRGSAE